MIGIAFNALFYSQYIKQIDPHTPDKYHDYLWPEKISGLLEAIIVHSITHKTPR